MSTESLKLQLIERLLRTTDEGLLKKVADLFRSEKGEDDDGLTDEHYNIVKERYEEYKRGEGKSYTWEETKAMIRAGKGKEA
ncbi:MAG: addiction module protein [Flavobacteriales bacterium]|nr:addiction module protein [Flavobacteriales bacterium]MBK7943470.1 addiction module protein [Flavobacteriales bacterium]MBK8950716.1 addiction module protein [Flavobacteriales bacterium]MBK9699841.1 addiction module protein [Flavobacteriales bacterium]